jgi:histidinol-phosphate aminotransferase
MSCSLVFNSVLESLPVYQPGRPIEEVARELNLSADDVIKLASNENPLGPSPAALTAMHKVLPQLHLYPDGNAFYLKSALAARLQVSASSLVLGNGSNEVLELVGHALLSPGDDVVVSQYCFAVYPIVTHLFGASLMTVPAKDYGHDLPAMLNAVTPRTKVVFVANPNNPTGTIARRSEVLQLVNELPPQALLVMDEAYLEYLDDAVDLLPMVRTGQRPNLLLTRTFSKIYGLAGLRVGYGVGHADVISALEKVREPFNLNTVAQAAALAALDDAEHITRTRVNNRTGLAFLQQQFKRLGLEYVPSAANFVLVKVGDGQRVFTELQELGVIVRPMGGYQLPQWVRITVGTPPENERCLQALHRVLA